MFQFFNLPLEKCKIQLANNALTAGLNKSSGEYPRFSLNVLNQDELIWSKPESYDPLEFNVHTILSFFHTALTAPGLHLDSRQAIYGKTSTGKTYFLKVSSYSGQ